MKILVTGGLGYIGSHITVELLEAGYSVVVLDNLINSKIEVLEKIKKIINNKRLYFFKVDIRDKEELKKIFKKNNVESVIHCAGLKIISESISNPNKYYDHNINGTVSLCSVMESYGVRNLIFSSSASVYNPKNDLPIKESSDLLPYNVYGRTKLFAENFLKDLKNKKDGWKILALRYFNPVSAHSTGFIGEIPKTIPTNLLPYISLVAIGKFDSLSIFGNNYDTFDGTAIRDYIHVVDLAKGHVQALRYINQMAKEDDFIDFINLGTGKGCSVLEMIENFEKVTDVNIPYKVKPRREGDIAKSFAEVKYARRKIFWKAQFDIKKMCSDQWNFVLKHKRYFERFR